MKFFAWICTIIWVFLAIYESVQCGMGMPIPEREWYDILLRDWTLASICIGKLFDEYF